MIIDYRQNVYAISGKYNANLLKHLRKDITYKHSGKLTKGVLFHQDNDQANLVLMTHLQNSGFEMGDRIRYSLEFGPF